MSVNHFVKCGIYPVPMLQILHRFLLIMCAACVGVTAGQTASAKPNKYASIIIDSDSLEILHARKIDDARYPASLTKMMTLYLTFDALEMGVLTLNESMHVSRNAARTLPVKLGLKAGRTISVKQAILALTVRSANDVAIVLAERLGGSVDEFAVQMNTKAKALGMKATVFKNPHGLPDSAQVTTARDMAKLAQALLKNHRKYYPYFSARTFTYQGRTYKNHNALLGKVEGVDGFKTGFTNGSGYNLVLSAKRDGHRIIAVVLGGASGKSRDRHMSDLIERGFDVVNRKQKGQIIHTVRKTEPVPNSQKNHVIRAVHAAPIKHNWAVQIGAYSTAKLAHNAVQNTQLEPTLNLANSIEKIIPLTRTNGNIYRARLTGLSHEKANLVCKTLAARAHSCLVVAPS